MKLEGTVPASSSTNCPWLYQYNEQKEDIHWHKLFYNLTSVNSIPRGTDSFKNHLRLSKIY